MIDYPIKLGVTIGLIPARGGSKSIPLKNLAEINGVPMIGYVIKAAQSSGVLSEIICSTDHPVIKSTCEKMGVIVYDRPKSLSGDEVHVKDVIAHVLEKYAQHNGFLPEYLVLLQPTSPFLRGEDVSQLLLTLKNDPVADSAQTVCEVVHNSHAYNQRIIDESGRIKFRYLEERKAAYNKQKKPKHYLFGNLLIMKSMLAFDETKDCFGDRSAYLIIPRVYALDVDGPDDLEYAQYLLKTGKIDLES